MQVRNFYELSFTVDVKEDEEIKFAYCIPYTYSDLLREMKLIKTIAEVGILGQTLTGIYEVIQDRYSNCNDWKKFTRYIKTGDSHNW